MNEYIYKGFKISYKITPLTDEKNAFKAEGSMSYLLNITPTFTPQKFVTEYDSYVGAEHEIKKMLENYINFELKNYYEMKKEKNELGA